MRVSNAPFPFHLMKKSWSFTQLASTMYPSTIADVLEKFHAIYSSFAVDYIRQVSSEFERVLRSRS